MQSQRIPDNIITTSPFGQPAPSPIPHSNSLMHSTFPIRKPFPLLPQNRNSILPFPYVTTIPICLTLPAALVSSTRGTREREPCELRFWNCQREGESKRQLCELHHFLHHPRAAIRSSPQPAELNSTKIITAATTELRPTSPACVSKAERKKILQLLAV